MSKSKFSDGVSFALATDPPVVAYAVVPEHDDENEFQLARYNKSKPASLPVAGRNIHHRVSRAYCHLPEARDLTWSDTFFDDEMNNNDIVAVFDMDYAAKESYYKKLGWCYYAGSLVLPHACSLSTAALLPCFLHRNVAWNVRTQHVAVTKDGICFVHDHRPSCWGWSCCDVGKQTKTIPFDQITDCVILEAAGSTCLCIPNTFHTVHIHTASSREHCHELTLTGLFDPEAFRKLVWAMKRLQTDHPSSTVAAALPAIMDRCDANHSDPDTAAILRDIRDELRAIRHASVANVASAPLEEPVGSNQ